MLQFAQMEQFYVLSSLLFNKDAETAAHWFWHSCQYANKKNFRKKLNILKNLKD